MPGRLRGMLMVVNSDAGPCGSELARDEAVRFNIFVD